MRIHLPIALLLLAGCSGHASKQDRLNAAANLSAPEADNSLAGVPGNGMSGAADLNAAAGARQGSAGASIPPKKEAQPNSAKSPGPPQPVQPDEDQPGNSNSD